MESLHANQAELFVAMSKLATNIKKDSADRKTVDYFKRRLDTLEQYWSDYQYNHDRLLTEESKSHPYFTKRDFEQAEELYRSTKTLINQQYQGLLKRMKLESSDISGPQQAVSQQADQNQDKQGLTTSEQEDLVGRATVQMRSMGSSSKLDEMLKKQASNFRAFQRTVSSINLENVSEKWVLEDALRTLQSRWSTIDSLHWELDSELEGSNEAYETSYTKQENIYNDLKKAINGKIWGINHKDHCTPKMDIPIFNGNYQNWVSFKDLFIEIIHSNVSISNAQKMQFLKSKVRGEAERLIQHLQISSENYSTCWEILNNRYNNIRLIFTSHANTLLNLPVVHQTSVNHIKKMHDTTQECLNAIKNLGVDINSWGPMIVHILLQKLDTDTHNQYLESLENPRDLPKLQDFLKFLESKFTTLESSRKKFENSKPSTSKPSNGSSNFRNQFNSNNKYAAKKVHSPFPQNTYSATTCPLCKESHGIYYCEKFLHMSPQVKRQTITKLHLCKNCLFDHGNKPCISEKRCRECQGKHNTLLHEAFSNSSCNLTTDTTPKVLVSRNQQQEPHENHVPQQGNNVVEILLLATAMIKVQASDGSYHKMRALIDQGSQASLVSERAAQVLALPRKQCKGVIFGIGEKESSCKGIINITCCSHYNQFTFNTDVLIMNTLITYLPGHSFIKPTWAHLDGIQLADPDFHISRPIDILLGADVYSYIILDGIIRADLSLPIAQQTRLGWILCGNIKTLHCNVVLNQVDEVQKFWEIEDITESPDLSAEDLQCVTFYKKTTTRQEDGRYEVRLPFQENFEEKLGSSKHKAIAQFNQVERKFNNNKIIANQYKQFIKEYQILGHMKPTTGNAKPEFYLPHHCVLRNESTTTALRVVFNASSKTTTGNSLNDLMLKGPNLQQDLQSLLLKWRQFRIAFTADIEKMFRFIWVHEQDQKFQKIIWRDSPHMVHQEYQLCTVTYGTKAAPFLAMMTLKQLAEDERQNYDREAIKALEQSFYMDDVLHGSHSVESAVKLQQELIKLLKSGGFNLRKWSSNAPELQQDVLGENNKQEDFDFKQVESAKTLGLRWNPKTDSFHFLSKIEPSTKTPTKRSMLSDISKLFDPLGWLSPVSTKLKLIFQKVWSSKLQWDDKLPDDILREWISIRDEMHKINQFELKRWLGTEEMDIVELHGFCDSSNKAYACVVYCKQVNNGNVKVSLVAGKARLVPANKTISLPRLELCGALLLAKLMLKIQQCLSNHTIKIYSWTDSMVVLAWLQGDPGKWKPFVANRVLEINKILPKNSWRYVKSAENPADCASRGINVDQLKNHSLWWEGPSWLPYHNTENNMNQTIFNTDEELRKVKQVNNVSQQDSDFSILSELLTRYSSLTKLTRVLAWVLRFTKHAKQNLKRKQTYYITLQEIKYAKYKIIKHVQEKAFPEEIKNLQESQPISTKSKLLQLNPYLDEHGLLRVRGRLNKASINHDMMHPIIIPHEGHLTNLIIDHAHMLTFHGGARVTSAAIRQSYWIIGGNRAVKKRIRTCVTCRKHNPNQMTQLMGDLPTQRCNVAKPFHHTGVDFTGHVYIKANKGRGIKTTKGYVAVFICMVTKLVHLELVSDLTSSAFLAALQRMAARKGSPQHMYSDNGTNFVGANKALQEEFEQIQKTFDQDFLSEITNMQIEWHFNAPSWPSAGGLWEAAVKSLKYHLRRVVGEQKLTFEEFSTILAKLEAVLNSRPLCPLTEDPNDLDFLTPSSFINLNQNMTVLETEADMRTRWHVTQKIVQDIWKRWRMEYLAQLSARSKWRRSQPDIKINDIVTINDANLPPGKWAIGRVVQLHPGNDGHIRVVTLKTKNGLIKRPIIKLSLLPVNDRTGKQELTYDERKNIPHKGFKKRSNYNLLSLAMLLMVFVNIFTTSHCAYNVTQLKENQGLYFDKISNMQLIRDEWKIITYYDMDPYWQGTTACSKYLNYLDKLCVKFKENSHCDVIQLQLQQEYSELEYYNHLLLSQHSSTRRARAVRRRFKRGFINGVGYLANSLFGVLDERFAEQYKQDIELIRDNEDHLALLIKNQTSIIEAENNILQRHEEAINKQHKMLNLLSIKLDKVENTLLNESERNRIMNDFSMGAVATSNFLRHLKIIQTTLLSTITDVYHGRLNFHLLSPEQLKETLNTISSHLAKDLSLPVNNLQTNLRNMYHLLKIKARMSEEYLIFELKVPLVSRDSFSIMKIIPIPQVINNTTMAIITPIADHVAINLKKDSYIPMSTYDVQSCLRDDTDAYLCHIPRPIYHLKNDEKLCEIEPDTRKCKISVTTCSNQWTETSKTNKYIYFCCSQCQIRVLCEDQASTGSLEKAGIVGVDHDCLIKTESFTVYSHNEGFSNLNMKATFELPDIEPINHIIDVGIPTPLIQNYSITSNNKEFEEIKKQLVDLKASENLPHQVSYHDIHHYTAFYVTIGVILIVGVVMAIRRLRRSRATFHAVANAALASHRATEQGTSAAASAGPPEVPSVVRVYSVSARNQCDSEIPNIHKVDKCTTPIPRATDFN